MVRIGSNVGTVIGPLLGAAAALAWLNAVFAVTGGLLMLAVLAELTFVPRDTVSVPDDDEEPEIPPGTLVLLRQQHTLRTTAYAALFTIAAVVVIAFQLAVNRLVRDLATGWSLLAGVAVQAIGLATLTLATHGYTLLIVAVVLMAAGQMIYGPTLQTYVTRRAGPNRRASYQAALSITEDLGTAVGPVTGLALEATFGPKAVWTTGALICCLAGLGSHLATTTPSRSTVEQLPL